MSAVSLKNIPKGWVVQRAVTQDEKTQSKAVVIRTNRFVWVDCYSGQTFKTSKEASKAAERLRSDHRELTYRIVKLSGPLPHKS